jgi:hypothetical protein
VVVDGIDWATAARVAGRSSPEASGGVMVALAAKPHGRTPLVIRALLSSCWLYNAPRSRVANDSLGEGLGSHDARADDG